MGAAEARARRTGRRAASRCRGRHTRRALGRDPPRRRRRRQPGRSSEIAFTEHLPPTLTDRLPRPGDDELVALACRRTTFEWVLQRLVLDEPGVELRHGVAAGTLVARSAGIPLVVGVDGSRADLVVDARGPRSSSDAWLSAIAAPPVREELHESGIVYFSRFHRA